MRPSIMLLSLIAIAVVLVGLPAVAEAGGPKAFAVVAAPGAGVSSFQARNVQRGPLGFRRSVTTVRAVNAGAAFVPAAAVFVPSAAVRVNSFGGFSSNGVFVNSASGVRFNAFGTATRQDAFGNVFEVDAFGNTRFVGNRLGAAGFSVRSFNGFGCGP